MTCTCNLCIDTMHNYNNVFILRLDNIYGHLIGESGVK